jgi:GcrA cell cycle regulator
MNNWTEERVELLKEGWADGLSASQISRALNCGLSRNAVISKVHRLGLAGRVTSFRTARKDRGTYKAPKPRLEIVPDVSPIVEEAPVTLADGTHITILTITDRMCRWPIGDPSASDFHFCGRAPKSGLPYCEAHARKAYQPKMTAAANKASSERADTRNMRRVG